MNPLKDIAVDIDGTVCNFANKFSVWMDKQGKPILNKDVFKHHEEYRKYERENSDECFSMPLYPDCQEVLQSIALKIPLTFLTKRATTSDLSLKSHLETYTIQWQQKHFPYFSGIFFAKNKEEYFEKGMFDLMIEDDASNANKIAEFAPVLLLSRSWNQGEKLHKNILVVEDWKEIQIVIDNWDKFKPSVLRNPSPLGEGAFKTSFL